MAATEVAGRPVSRRAGRSLRQRESRAGFLLVSPTLLLVLVMVVLPVLWTVLLAVQRIRLSGIRHVGIFGAQYTVRNFERLFESPDFLDSLRVTLLYSILGTAGSIGLGLVAALVVRSTFPGRTLVRGAMLLPYVAPIVAVAFVWQVVLNPQFGIVNALGTRVLHWGDAVPFLSEEHGTLRPFGLRLGVPTALVVVILFEAWRYFPFAFLFILARLQALPAELDEAARVDGATPLQRFWYITLPQLTGVIALLAVLRFIFTFNKFDDIYLLTGGGAGTEVLGVQVYNFLTARNDVGASAAVALLMAAVMAVFVGVYLRFFVPGEEAP
jgi:multiple sugar transport system permease protein